MRSFVQRVKERWRRFMMDRYGSDELSRLLSRAALVHLLLSFIPDLRFLFVFAFALLLLASLRCLSKDKYARQGERSRYLSIQYKLKKEQQLLQDRWRERKTHRYYRCPHCKTVIRITKPERGKKIVIRCPMCRQSFEKKI